MTTKVITFQAALDETKAIKRHLLLGNGFSISLFPDKFTYGSLLEEANFKDFPQARRAFECLGTNDFEVVIHALRQASVLLPLYSSDVNAQATMEANVEGLRELLVQSIAGRHPERPSEINENQYQQCRKFLAHFIGSSREKPVQSKDLKGSIYTLNYDLLLYWALLHTPNYPDEENELHKMKHDDGFRVPDEDPDAEYVTWDGEETHTQCIHYLHGAMHLYDYGYELQKKCWERSGGKPLIEQIRNALNEERFPLFVSEGASKEKLERIRHSGYLHKSLRSFRGNCDVKNASLFIFGHSLADNDAHVLKQIEKGKIGHIYVSLYGDPEKPENKEIMRRAQHVESNRNEKNAVEIKFFDAASAEVWSEGGIIN